ncbi:MAG: hypothetical protein ACRBCJ_10705 [Hyphomicrobiaceae bacterium]
MSDSCVAWLSLVLTIAIPVAVYLGRQWLVAWVTKHAQHSFDAKLEELRAKLRTTEEQFKSGLRSKEDEITALRNSLLSGSVSRQSLLDKRRLEAVEKIWKAVNDSAKIKYIANVMSVLNYDALAKESSDQRMQKFLSTIGANAPKPTELTNVARDERPYVSEIVWAYFSAYLSILHVNLARFELLKSGVENPQKLLSTAGVKKILKAVLPHQTSYIDGNDAGAYVHLLDEIETLLLNELRGTLEGRDADNSANERARDILRKVNEFESENLEKTL